MKQEVPVYFIFIRGINDDRTFPNAWLTVFGDVARNTAGRMFYAEPVMELKAECVKLAQEIRSQYVIGYTSTNTAQDGKWRGVRVTLNPPPGQQKPNLRYRSRYFVPKAGSKG